LTKSQKKITRRYPKEPDFQNSEYFVLFLDNKILHKSVVIFVLGWSQLNKIFIFPFFNLFIYWHQQRWTPTDQLINWFWVGICMGGTLKTQSFLIALSYLLNTKSLNKLPSVLFFGEICWTKLNKIVILPYFPLNPKAKLRLEVLFKKIHPRINLATLFSTKLYLLNTIKSFSGHDNRSLTKSQKGGYP
jgi:hypothetical protein